MNYTQALDYIHAVNWVFCNPGLDRVRTLCSSLGNPQDSLKFIHVAGTNGKGSLCAMTASVLRAAGLRVGLYTSPYIVRFNERMQIDGESISDEELCELVEVIRPHADAMEDKPTEFELITALAFLYFARHNCDIVVLECGLGGRLDATNIIKEPILSVITGIALDHTAILGDTIAQIAAEKAGILKSGCTALWCGTDEDAHAVIRQKADEVGAPLYTVRRDDLTVLDMTLDGTTFDFGDRKNLHIPLLGSYQPYNAANALSVIDLLNDHPLFDISEDAIRQGLANVRWPARFEIIHRDPLVIADGGHNPDGIDAAVDSIKRYFEDGKVAIVTGVMADKDYRYMASRMAEVACRVFCLTPDNPRSLPAEDYARVFSELGIKATPCASVTEAVKAGMSYAKEQSIPLVCLGSLYMYGEVVGAIS